MTNEKIILPADAATIEAKSFRSSEQHLQDLIEDDEVRLVLGIGHQPSHLETPQKAASPVKEG